MLAILGNLTLMILILLSLINIILTWKGQVTRETFCLQFWIATAGLITLITGFIISDFSIENVLLHSHELQPLTYKIAAAWGNHEGSLILINFIVTLYIFVFNRTTNLDSYNKSRFNYIVSFVILFLSGYILFTSNPFKFIGNASVPARGLNPLLQDIGLTIHPPILYMGYMGFIVAFALSYIIKFNLDNQGTLNLILKEMRIWAFISWAFMTLGIGLGSWWAYRELGWGGFWFWDPVENLSLLPWMSGIALIHIVILSCKKLIYCNFTRFLGFLTFFYSVCSSFLVRSGLLTSVHSFAYDSVKGIILLLYVVMLGFFILMEMRFNIKSKKFDSGFFTRESLLTINAGYFVLGSIIILLSIVYPIVIAMISNKFISIGAPYFEKTFLPIMMPVLFFTSLSGIALWGHNNLVIMGKKYATGLILAIIPLYCIIEYYGSVRYIVSIGMYLSISLMIITALDYIKNRKHAIFLGHFGFGLLILSAIISIQYSVSKEKLLYIGDKIYIEDFTLKFHEITYSASDNYLSQRAGFIVDHDNKSFIIEPEVRLFPVEQTTTTETAIKSFIFQDLYISTGRYDTEKGLHVRIYLRRFINFIWISVILMTLSVLPKIPKFFGGRKQH